MSWTASLTFPGISHAVVESKPAIQIPPTDRALPPSGPSAAMGRGFTRELVESWYVLIC